MMEFLLLFFTAKIIKIKHDIRITTATFLLSLRTEVFIINKKLRRNKRKRNAGTKICTSARSHRLFLV